MPRPDGFWESQQRLPYKTVKNSFREFQINNAAVKKAYYSSGGFATPKQLLFIKNLAAEKGVEKISQATGIFVPENRIPTKQEAIVMIEKLITL